MTVITVTGSSVYVGREYWGHVRQDDGRVFTTDMRPVGTVTRVESVGPRGGKRTEWHAWADTPARGGHTAVFSTRNDAVAYVVESVGSVDDAPARVGLPDAVCPDCGDSVEYDGVKPMHLQSGDAECGPVPDHTRPLDSVAHAIVDALSGETDVDAWDTGAVLRRVGESGRNVTRVGVCMSTRGEVIITHMDAGGAVEGMETVDPVEGSRFARVALGLRLAECVVCGDPVDCCAGHGYPDGNYAAYVWAAHDAGCHGACRAECRTEGQRGVLIVSREYDPDTDVHDGEIDYAETYAEWVDDAPVLDAVDVMQAEHLTTHPDANGPEVWDEGDARGQNVNYRTGTVTEVTGYLEGYTGAECAVIAALATGDTWTCGGVSVSGVGHRVDPVYRDQVDATGPASWFRAEDYTDEDAFLVLDDGDYLPVSDVMALRESFAPGASVMEPDNVHRVLHGASTDSVWSGYGVIVDEADGTYSVVRMSW